MNKIEEVGTTSGKGGWYRIARSGNGTKINPSQGFTSLGEVCESEIDWSKTARPAKAALLFIGRRGLGEKNYGRKDQASQTAWRVGGAAVHGDGGGAWVAGHEALGRDGAV